MTPKLKCVPLPPLFDCVLAPGAGKGALVAPNGFGMDPKEPPLKIFAEGKGGTELEGKGGAADWKGFWFVEEPKGGTPAGKGAGPSLGLAFGVEFISMSPDASCLTLEKGAEKEAWGWDEG